MYVVDRLHGAVYHKNRFRWKEGSLRELLECENECDEDGDDGGCS